VRVSEEVMVAIASRGIGTFERTEANGVRFPHGDDEMRTPDGGIHASWG
jgi:hypothetical protein